MLYMQLCWTGVSDETLSAHKMMGSGIIIAGVIPHSSTKNCQLLHCEKMCQFMISNPCSSQSCSTVGPAMAAAASSYCKYMSVPAY